MERSEVRHEDSGRGICALGESSGERDGQEEVIDGWRMCQDMLTMFSICEVYCGLISLSVYF